MPRRMLPLLITVVLLFVACGADETGEQADPDVSLAAPSSTTEQPATSTTEPSTPPSTVYAPDTIEGEIETDYLAAWDAYGAACSSADPSGLDDHYAEAALGYRQQNIDELASQDAVGECVVEHDYVIAIVGDGIAAVSDDYVNHMRLVDPETGSYLEPDPNVRDGSVYTLEKRDETWIVIDINSLEPS